VEKTVRFMALPGNQVVICCKNFFISTYKEGIHNSSGLHIFIAHYPPEGTNIILRLDIMNTAVLMICRIFKEEYRRNFHDVFTAAFVRTLLKKFNIFQSMNYFKIKVFYLIRRRYISKETFSFATFTNKYLFSNIEHKLCKYGY
jgi:hypothetical protein